MHKMYSRMIVAVRFAHMPFLAYAPSTCTITTSEEQYKYSQ